MTKTSDEITQELIDWQFGDGLLKQDTKPGTKFVDKFASKSPTEVYIPGKYKSEPGEEAMFTSSVDLPKTGVNAIEGDVTSHATGNSPASTTSAAKAYIPGQYQGEPGEEAMFTSSVRPSRGVWSVDDIKGSVFTSDYIEGGTPKSRSR